MTQATEELRLLPGIRNVAAHIGRAVTGDQVVGVESAQLWVSIDPKADYGATLAAIRDTVRAYPGFNADVQTYLSDRVTGVLTGKGEPIVVRVQGPEREVLRREAEKVAKMLSGIAGLANARVEGRAEAPQIEIKVDLAAAGQVGLKPGDVRRAAATVFAGLEVGNLYEQQKVFDVVVWGAPESRRQPHQCSRSSDRHAQRRLRPSRRTWPTCASCRRRQSSSATACRAASTSTADAAGRSVSSILSEVKERLAKEKFPLEYHAVVLGAYEERQAALWQPLFAALAAAIGIYLLLQAWFQSWRVGGSAVLRACW